LFELKSLIFLFINKFIIIQLCSLLVEFDIFLDNFFIKFLNVFDSFLSIKFNLLQIVILFREQLSSLNLSQKVLIFR